MDGYLKIKTKIDNKEIDKGITELESKIKKMQEDSANLNKEQTLLQKEINNYEELGKKAEVYRQKIKQLEQDKKAMYDLNPELAVSTPPELSNLEAQIDSTKSKYAQATTELDKQAPKIDKLYFKLDKIKSKQNENNTKINIFKKRIESIKAKNVQNSIDNVGQKVQKSIGKIGKMAMAVIGVRTAFNAVRSAMNLATQYSPQLSANFEYMRFCLANLVIPVVQKLSNLLFTVLSYINSIAKAWFGINLFGNSSVKAFKKMQNSAGGTAKSAKEIQKSLQGFDEMNVLSDNSDKSSGSGGVSPNVDLSGVQGDVPKWLQWIIDNKDIVLSIFAGITAGIIALKLGLGGLKSLGIGLLVAGIVLLIQDIIKFIEDPSFNNFLNILRDIALIVAGIAVLLGAWPVVIGAVIALIVIEIVKHWDEIKEILRKNWTVDI